MPTLARPAPPRLHARGDPRLLRADRRRQVQQHDRHGAARARDPRAISTPRPARDGRAAAAQGRARQLSRGQGRGARRAPTTRQMPEPARARCRSRASSTSSATTSWRTPPKKFFRLAPGGEVRLRYAYLITLRRGREGRRRRGRRAALHVRSRDARRRRPRRAQGEGHDPLGLGRARGARAEVRLYDRLFTVEDPDAAAGTTLLDDLNPQSLEVTGRRAASSRRSRAAPRGDAFQFERLGYFCVDPRLEARRAGLQPHRRAQGHLGEDRQSEKLRAQG